MDLLKRLAGTVALGVALAVVVWLAMARLGPLNLQGKPAPDFTLYDLQGQEVAISDFRGHPAILDFWASWCAPCIDYMATLDEIQEEHPELRTLAINIDGSRRFVDRIDPTRRYPHLEILHTSTRYDILTEMKEAYGVGPIPRTLILDQQGIVRADMQGAHPKEKILTRLQTLGLLEPAGEQPPA
ncbi:MAG: TlpA family protein disulfide reductase [Armatimonadota bacterium]